MSFVAIPWEFVDGEIRDADGRVLALLKTKGAFLPASYFANNSYLTEREHNRNGLLFAASPSLFEALKWCVDHNGECLGDHPAQLRAYRAFLAQAGGAK